MKKTLLTLTLLLAPAAYAQDTTDTTTTETTTTTTETTEPVTTETTDVTTTESTEATTDVENDAVTTAAESDGVAGNEREPAGFPWGLLGLLGLAGLMGRSRPAPVVHTTTTHTEPRRDTVVTGTTQVNHTNDNNRR